MEIEKFEVVISQNAIGNLKEIYRYIAEQSSEDVAEKVAVELLKIARSLEHTPRRYPKERLVDSSLGEIRFALKWSYKIHYKIHGKRVIVLRLFHTSRDPGLLEDLGEE